MSNDSAKPQMDLLGRTRALIDAIKQRRMELAHGQLRSRVRNMVQTKAPPVSTPAPSVQQKERAAAVQESKRPSSFM